VIHLDYERYDLRAVGVPGSRPRIGENVGLQFDPEACHVFDDATGLALR
jgi:hypothetical protein